MATHTHAGSVASAPRPAFTTAEAPPGGAVAAPRCAHLDQQSGLSRCRACAKGSHDAIGSSPQVPRARVGGGGVCGARPLPLPSIVQQTRGRRLRGRPDSSLRPHPSTPASASRSEGGGRDPLSLCSVGSGRARRGGDGDPQRCASSAAHTRAVAVSRRRALPRCRRVRKTSHGVGRAPVPRALHFRSGSNPREDDGWLAFESPKYIRNVD